MTALRLSVGLVLLLAGCNEIPQIEQQRQELEKKSTAVHGEIGAVNTSILRVQESIEQTIAGTTVATISNAYELVVKDTEGQVAELAKRLDAAEQKLSGVRRDIDEYQQKYKRP